jgi:hypothetical protein
MARSRATRAYLELQLMNRSGAAAHSFLTLLANQIIREIETRELRLGAFAMLTESSAIEFQPAQARFGPESRPVGRRLTLLVACQAVPQSEPGRPSAITAVFCIRPVFSENQSLDRTPAVRHGSYGLVGSLFGCGRTRRAPISHMATVSQPTVMPRKPPAITSPRKWKSAPTRPIATAAMHSP